MSIDDAKSIMIKCALGEYGINYNTLEKIAKYIQTKISPKDFDKAFDGVIDYFRNGLSNGIIRY